MRKKIFSRVTVGFTLLLIGLMEFMICRTMAGTLRQAKDINALLNELDSLTVEAKEPKDNNYQLYKQCYAELVWQSNQVNLLYCAELEQPVIRAVADNNWNLIEDAFIYNSSSNENLDVIEVSPCALGVTEFYYLPADDITSESKNPPESGWIQTSANESGNYLLPLKEGDVVNGNYYTVFKYVIYDDIYYGMFCLSTLF